MRMKMRLIDADALLKRVRKDPLFPLVEQYGIGGVIEAEPTVEAIPMWFIKGCQDDHLIFITELIDAWEKRKAK